VPVINAQGNSTILGGSMLGERVRVAMEASNRYFVDMRVLLERAEQLVAELVQCEAAYVTPGCAAALALGAAACLTGGDRGRMARLPDTAGLRHRLVIQSGHRYKYDHTATISGGCLVEAGYAGGTTAAQLAAALASPAAALLFPAHLDGKEGTVGLRESIGLAHDRGVPVLVDAAAQIYPPERMRSWTQMGCDLVCFGAKYFGAPNSTGLLCGRHALVEAAATQGFIGFEYAQPPVFGRPLKLDRGEIIAVVVALREWLTLDHGDRIARVQARADALASRLAGVPGLTPSLVPQRHFGAPGLRVAVSSASGTTADALAADLKRGRPSIWAPVDGDALSLNLFTVPEGDEALIAERLRALVVA